MRRNLYNKNIDAFLKALESLGWREITLDSRSADRQFRKGGFHLILRSRKAGHYCILHKDRFRIGHHARPICKGVELIRVYHGIIIEYKKIRSLGGMK